MTQEEKYQYLAKFLAGEMDEKELMEFNNWLSLSEEHSNMLEETAAIWEASAPATAPNTLKSWHKVKGRIEPKPNKFRWLRVAMILALVGGSLWFLLNKESVQERTVVYATAMNESQEIELEDGSLVVLSGASNLTVKYPWDTDRKMEFIGNAYFKVQPDPQRPFKVKTPEGEIRVLGTAFFIDTRVEERKNLLAVEEGKVRFTNPEATGSIDIPLGFALSKPIAKQENLVPLNHLDSYWLHHSLLYNNESVGVIFQDLEKIFNCKIKVENTKLLKCKFSGKFKDNNLDEILEVISFALDLSINKLTGQQMTIIGNGCQ